MKVKKIITLVTVMLLALTLTVGCGQQTPPPPPPPPADDTAVDAEVPEVAPEPVEILIGAAMSLADVVAELSEVYMDMYGHVTVVNTFASSGALQGQIEEGAPIDIFFSAAAAQMNNLIEQELIHGGSRNVVRNTVALIVPAGSDIELDGFADVAAAEIGIIGLGDPDAMPIGRFAQEIFIAHGIETEVYNKAVLASDVRQLLTWVEMGEVDAGVVFMTDAITTDDVRVIEVADPELHSPSVNPVGVVEGTPSLGEAQNFVDFLFSSTARAIFERHGFTMY